ncbi:MAG: ShlB/FhaC/HecB family hemolysin secretion/activation protein, partial [Psychrilyobacter sp.]|uniref:ShlB/FhaC/HecB family hemolysin secretion/activation protein n=1 Tax=Psychrilyobacter sp. TaxID=2586924 RepID=UPI003C7774D5
MKKKTVFFFVGVLLINNVAMSNDIVSQVRDARNEFEVQQKREKEEKIQELLRTELLKKEEKATPQIKKMGEKKYEIKKLILEGAILLDEKTKQKIASKYMEKKIGMEEIYELVGEITNEYIKRGYVTTKVTIPLDQSLANGKLKLKVIPGTIENIIYNDLSFRDRMKIYMAFPTKKGEYLNLFELEQGISNLNNVVYNNAKMDLVPGGESGKSIVSIENKRNFSGITLGYDNLGQKSTGKEKLNLSLRTGDFIGNDTLSINGSKNLDGDDSFKYNKSISGSYNIPFGFWSAGVSYSYSKYLTTISGIVKPIKSSGNSTLTTYKLSRVLGRVGQGKVSFETNLSIKSKNDFINDLKIEVSSRTTSNIKNQLNYVGRLKGGSLYVDLSQTMGLYGFGATKDINTS